MQNNQQSAQDDRIPVKIKRGLYHRVKADAARKHLTINQYLEQLLDEMVPEINDVVKPGHPPTREDIERLREVREQLYCENNYQFFENSVEEIRQMREERMRQLMGEDYVDEQ
ncbi:MAG: hypothetical protein ACRDHW_12905 [Ktedonobacteraceae bacterium]